MLKVNYPTIENKKLTDLESNLVEPSYKINCRVMRISFTGELS